MESNDRNNRHDHQHVTLHRPFWHPHRQRRRWWTYPGYSSEDYGANGGGENSFTYSVDCVGVRLRTGIPNGPSRTPEVTAATIPARTATTTAIPASAGVARAPQGEIATNLVYAHHQLPTRSWHLAAHRRHRWLVRHRLLRLVVQ